MQTQINNRWQSVMDIAMVLGFSGLLLWTLNSLSLFSNHTGIWFTYVLTMILIWWMLRWRGGILLDFGFSPGNRNYWKKTVLQSLLTLLGAVMAFLLGGMLALNLGLVQGPPDMSSYDYIKGNIGVFILVLMAVYIGSSLGEEIVFRGFLITRLMKIIGGKWAGVWSVIISGVTFGLVHVAWGPMGMIQTTFMGWALGYFYLHYGKNLWVTVLAHAYMDTILMVQMYGGTPN